jgi:phage/plasmid primase-like uncharacterized protein
MNFENTSTRDLSVRWKLHRAGREWRGDCPACGYAASFILTETSGRTLGWCASCQDKDAIGALIRGHGAGWVLPDRTPTRDPAKDRSNSDRALRLWNRGQPCAGTPAAAYLAGRGLPALAASSALKFVSSCPHPNGAKLPAMVALFTDAAGNPTGIHRTFIRADGAGKAAVEPAKATLGGTWGSAIRLAPLAAEIVVGEGIESAASAGLIFGLPAWAAFSAGNLGVGLILPSMVRRVVVAADNDPPDRFGRHPGQDAAKTASERWAAEGRASQIATPKSIGQDFNDVLRGQLAGETAHA